MGRLVVLRRALAVAATVLVAVVGLASPAASAYPPVRPTKVLVLGDSVMKGAEQQFIAAMGPDREVVVDAEVNRSTGTGADIVAQRGGDWDVVIVMLGHNDGGSEAVFQPAARRLLDGLKDVPWVSWLSIHEVRDYYPPVNQFIAGLQGEYPNLHIADWNTVAEAHPEGIAGDGLHLGPEGALQMAGLALQQVEAAEAAYAERFEAYVTPTTTTTTAAPKADEPNSTVELSGDRGPESTAGTTAITDPADDDGPSLLAIGGVVAALVVVGAASIGWIVRKRRSDDRGGTSR